MTEQTQVGRSVFRRIVWHPITGMIVGALSMIVLFVLLGRQGVEPRYAVSEPELLVEQTFDAPGLTVLWDGKEIKNVYSVKIAIWNAGRQYLDRNRLSNSDPVRVVYPQGARILYHDFIKTSRSSVDFDTIDLADTGTSAIQIEILDDEALDQGDGGVMKILYTGEYSKEFAVMGRIKGSKGFKRVGWDYTVGMRRIGVVFAIPIAIVCIWLSIYSMSLVRMEKGIGKVLALFLVALPLIFGIGAVYSISMWLLVGPRWIR